MGNRECASIVHACALTTALTMETEDRAVDPIVIRKAAMRDRVSRGQGETRALPSPESA